MVSISLHHFTYSSSHFVMTEKLLTHTKYDINITTYPELNSCKEHKWKN